MLRYGLGTPSATSANSSSCGKSHSTGMLSAMRFLGSTKPMHGFSQALADQEMAGHEALVVRRAAVPRVQGQQFVQQRCPGPPMADHKQGIVVQDDAIQGPGQQQILHAAQGRIEQRS